MLILFERMGSVEGTLMGFPVEHRENCCLLGFCDRLCNQGPSVAIPYLAA